MAISADITRDALRAIRYGLRLDGNALLGLQSLTERLRSTGVSDTPASRAWELGRWLDALTAGALHDARRAVGLPEDGASGSHASGDELAHLRRDFRSGNKDLEACSLVRYRYFTANPQHLEVVADALGVVYRTLARRLNRGHDLLAQRLQEAELAAAAAIQAGTRACAPGAAAPTFPTTAAAPTVLTTIVGRDPDVAAVRALLAEHRLVTVIGAGGIGKTRLAIEVVAGAPNTDAIDVAWVALDRVDVEGSVSLAVAAAAGLTDVGATDIESSLATFLADRRLLLILDNCEHVRDKARHLVEIMLRSCPNVRMLATSREPLRIPGEKLWPLPLLTVPDHTGRNRAPRASAAAELFALRAADVSPDFRITPANSPAVARICRQLDGLPLAIELAAAAMRAMPVEAIAEHLSAHHRLLSRPSAGKGRHDTLRATIDWSWDRLDDRERRLFRRLSVFAGSFTLQAVEQVAADGEGTNTEAIDTYDVLDLLTVLVEKSLVVAERGPDGSARYRLLQTLRTYGQERLGDAGEDVAVAHRHAAHFASWAAGHDLEGAGGGAWLRRFDVERDNLQAALSWSLVADPALATRLAAPLGTYWLMRGALNLGRLTLEHVLEHLGSPDDDAGLAVLEIAGRVARQQGDFAAARRHLDIALERRNQRGDTAGAAGTLRELGNIAEEQGDVAAAERFYQASRERYEASCDAWGTAAVLNNLGILAQHRGDAAGAVPLLERSLATFRNLDVPFAIGIALSNLAGVQADLGRLDRAAMLFDESLAIARGLDDTLGIASIQSALGYIRFREGRRVAAQEAMVEASQLLLELGDLQKQAEWLATAALIACSDGGEALAAELLGAEDGLRAKIGAPVPPKEIAERSALQRTLVEALGQAGFDEARGDGERRGWAAMSTRVLGAWGESG